MSLRDMANYRRGRHTLTNRHRKPSRSLPRTLALVLGLCAIAVAGTASAGAGDDPGGHAQAGAHGTFSKSVMVAPPAGYPVLGVDVSSHDHSVIKDLDWAGVAASGVQFAYVKATEGKTYANPYFHSDNVAAKSVGLLTGAYMFARPDLKDPVGEANYFIDHAEWVNDSRTLIPFLDLEWPYSSLNLSACWGLSPADMVAYIHALVDQVKARTGRVPMIYTNVTWWNPCTDGDTTFSDVPLDLASWASGAPTNIPTSWTKFTVWQYAGGNNSVAGDYDKMAFNGDYPGLTRLAGAAPAVEAPFELRAHANDRYVSADNGGNSPLTPNRTAIGAWEQYDFVDAGNGAVALRAHANGRYVTADNAGNNPLIANRASVGDWERFKVVTNDDGSISLRAEINGKYVTAENGGRSALIANRTEIGDWEKFAKVPLPDAVNLRANANGKYVTAENGGKSPLIARATAIGAWEGFDIIDLGDGSVALRAHANGLYITAENAGNSPLIANRTSVGDWERFTVVVNPDASISIKANVNGKYVTAEAGGAQSLIANRAEIGDWERFTRIG